MRFAKWMTQEFDRAYAKTGRLSIAPERFLRALPLQVHAMKPLDAPVSAASSTSS